MDHFRLFISCHIMEVELINSIKSIQSLFKLKGIKLIDVNNLHITFHFLGETHVKLLNEIKQIIDQINLDQFTVLFEGLGVFPSINRPRVLWIGVSKGKLNLKKINKILLNSLLKLGFQLKESKFSPHLTIARIKGLNSETSNILNHKLQNNYNKVIGMCNIDCIQLIKSQLTSKGPVYTSLFKKELIYNEN